MSMSTTVRCFALIASEKKREKSTQVNDALTQLRKPRLYGGNLRWRARPERTKLEPVLPKPGMKHLIDAVVGGIVKYFVPKVLDWLLGLCNKRRRKRLR